MCCLVIVLVILVVGTREVLSFLCELFCGGLVLGGVIGFWVV